MSNGLGEITTTAYVTEGIVPGTIAISHHFGRKYLGIYGSGKPNPIDGGAKPDPDAANIPWTRHGVHPNAIISNRSELISGAERWFDTVVRVTRA